MSLKFSSLVVTAASAFALSISASAADGKTGIRKDSAISVVSYQQGTAAQGIVGTGIEGIVGTGVHSDGIVGTGIEGIVGTGVHSDGIVGTGVHSEGIVGTGLN